MVFSLVWFFECDDNGVLDKVFFGYDKLEKVVLDVKGYGGV